VLKLCLFFWCSTNNLLKSAQFVNNILVIILEATFCAIIVSFSYYSYLTLKTLFVVCKNYTEGNFNIFTQLLYFKNYIIKTVLWLFLND